MSEQAAIYTDDVLTWRSFQESATKVPNQVLYETISADSKNDNGFSFNFRGPADNALLDNEISIQYQFKLTSVGFITAMGKLGFTNMTPTTDGLLAFPAFKQCFPVARCLQNLSVTINGSNFNVQPAYWIDVLNRLYFTEEEASTYCSTSGGEFDGPKRDYYSPAQCLGIVRSGRGTGDVALDKEINLGGMAPVADKSVCTLPITNNIDANTGLWARMKRFYNQVAQQSFTYYNTPIVSQQVYTDKILAGHDVNGTDTFTFTLTERIPIAPFVFHPSKDPKMSIPNIKQISINAQFRTNYYRALLQGTINGVIGVGGDVADRKAVTLELTDCNLLAKWYLTDLAIPPAIRLPAPKYQQYIENKVVTFSNTYARGPSSAADWTFSNIQLDSIPDKFIMFVRRSIDDEECGYPSEFNLSIKNITLTIGGASGRLMSLTPEQMYNNFLNYSHQNGGKKLDFDSWYKYSCAAILEPSDIGLIAGAGYNYKTNMTVKMGLESWWNSFRNYGTHGVPYTGGTNIMNFQMVILCCYNRHFIELNSMGGSKSGMSMIPRV